MAAKLLVATDDMILAVMRRMVNQGLITVEQYNESFTRALEKKDTSSSLRIGVKEAEKSQSPVGEVG